MWLYSNIVADEGTQRPPLFIVAYSAKGERFEGLLEPDRIAPPWFQGKLALHVTTPGGTAVDRTVDEAVPSIGYDQCYNLIDAAFAWKPLQSERVRDRRMERQLGVEVWAWDQFEVTNDETWLRIDDYSSGSAENSRGGNDFPHMAIIRNLDGSILHTAAFHLLYIDILQRGSRGKRAIPRAVIDTGLAGAFWGYSARNNKQASFWVAQRLLQTMFEDEKLLDSAVSAVAAGHAILTHDTFADKYASDLVNHLSGSNVPDVLLLKPLLKIALAPEGKDISGEIVDDIREAISSLAHTRPVFGETIRLLASQYSVLEDILAHSKCSSDDRLQSELATIRKDLARSHVGGQLAVYEGEPFGKDNAKKKIVPLPL